MNASIESADAAVDWQKGDGLVPAIVQDAEDSRVLMLGYMNRDALAATLATRRVTFWSRSRNALWQKGDTSGNVLHFVDATIDCDRDTLLVRARASGPVCHTGAATCFGSDDAGPIAFLHRLDALIAQRASDKPAGSYTTSLFDKGTAHMAQKVGEEGVEVALAAVTRDDRGLLEESADLVFHLMVLLRARGLGLTDVAGVLGERHAKPKP